MTGMARRRRIIWIAGILVAATVVVTLALSSDRSDPAVDERAVEPSKDSLTGGSWAKTIEESNIRIYLDWDAAKLLTVFPTGSGNKIAELDLAGSNPFYSDRFGTALWPQCEQVAVWIAVDEELPAVTRDRMRQVTVEALLSLRYLTGLDIVVGRGGTELAEVFSKANQRVTEPDEHILEIHWVDHRNSWLAPDELGTATVWHQLSNLGSNIGSGRIQLSSRIFDSLPEGQFDEPSRQLGVLHELAHIFGVGHSTDSESFMYPSMGKIARITPADRTALALAGSRPC